MRCKACNKIYASDDWIYDTNINDYDDLCSRCRSVSDLALFELEEKYDEGQDTRTTDTKANP